MQELTYQLQKEDYQDWIHWNVGRQNLRRMQVITFVIYIAFLVFYLGSTLAARRDPVSLIGAAVIAVLLGFFMFRTVSAKHQEKVVWKKSGLAKLEKQGGFPTVRLTVREDGVTMEVPDQVVKEYSFAEISELQEINRLFLMGAADKTWQFVAKSAFDSDEEMDEFRTFMKEKIMDAKENPEKYRKKEKEELKAPQALDGAEQGDSEGDASSGDGDESCIPITPVDTSKMGKIGKMAHIMAAAKADCDTDGEEESGTQREAVSGEAIGEELGAAPGEEDSDSEKL